MKIWLVTVGEPVPVNEGGKDRLHRTGYLAHYLAEHGHRVTWWTSTFDHFRKKHWFPNDHHLHVNEWLEIRMLHGGGYRSNVSWARFRDHCRIARKFAVQSRQQQEIPDVILSALPTIELCDEAVAYGRERGCPVILDMRDMWPDIFVDCVPRFARPAARLLLLPLFRRAKRACSNATAIVGITDPFLEWGLRRGQRERSVWDRSFPLGYISTPPAVEAIRSAEKYWDSLGVVAHAPHFVVCFFGTFGRQLDLSTVLQAARILQSHDKPIRFVLCGAGDRLEQFRRAAADLHNVLLPGWVDRAAIYVLLRRSGIGLDPLPDRYDFLATINNKAIEYLSAGLPVLSSPQRGLLAELLAQEECGLSYENGDAESLANHLLRLQETPTQLRELSQNAQRVFREKFSAERVYGEMMAYVESIAINLSGRSRMEEKAA